MRSESLKFKWILMQEYFSRLEDRDGFANADFWSFWAWSLYLTGLVDTQRRLYQSNFHKNSFSHYNSKETPSNSLNFTPSVNSFQQISPTNLENPLKTILNSTNTFRNIGFSFICSLGNNQNCALNKVFFQSFTGRLEC